MGNILRYSSAIIMLLFLSNSLCGGQYSLKRIPPPTKFNLTIEKTGTFCNGIVLFDLKENIMKGIYTKHSKIVGKIADKPRVLKANLQPCDIRLLYNFILVNEILKIENGVTLGKRVFRSPNSTIKFSMQIELKDSHVKWNCSVKNINIYSDSPEFRKLWNFYNLINLLLKMRCDETLNFCGWIIEDLEKRIASVSSDYSINSESELQKHYPVQPLDYLSVQLQKYASEKNSNKGKPEMLLKKIKRLFNSYKVFNQPYTGTLVPELFNITPFGIKEEVSEPKEKK